MTDTNANQDVTLAQSTTQVQTLQEQLTVCQADTQAWKEKFLRVSADYQNYTRRADKERSEWMQVAQTTVLKELLPLIDDVERALQELHKKEQTAEVASVVTGVDMIGAAFKKMLTKYGVQEITDVAVFNPDLHEALVSVESADHKAGDIIAVLQKGYKLNDQILRHVKVSVAK